MLPDFLIFGDEYERKNKAFGKRSVARQLSYRASDLSHDNHTDRLFFAVRSRNTIASA